VRALTCCCRSARVELAGRAAVGTLLRLGFLVLSRFHPKCFRNAPEGQDRRIALAELEAADVSSINSHSLGSPAANNARPAASRTDRALVSHRRFHFEWAEGPGTATAGDCHRKGPAPASRPFLS
jgi:hypothetical protein